MGPRWHQGWWHLWGDRGGLVWGEHRGEGALGTPGGGGFGVPGEDLAPILGMGLWGKVKTPGFGVKTPSFGVEFGG